MMTPAKTFRDLILWQKAHAFVLAVYRLTEGLPKSELYGSTSQFLRAAVSVPANMAEGFGKRGKPGKLRFYNIAQGSVEECHYHLILSHDLGCADTRLRTESLNEVGRLLEGYCSSLAAGS